MNDEEHQISDNKGESVFEKMENLIQTHHSGVELGADAESPEMTSQGVVCSVAKKGQARNPEEAAVEVAKAFGAYIHSVETHQYEDEEMAFIFLLCDEKKKSLFALHTHLRFYHEYLYDRFDELCSLIHAGGHTKYVYAFIHPDIALNLELLLSYSIELAQEHEDIKETYANIDIITRSLFDVPIFRRRSTTV